MIVESPWETVELLDAQNIAPTIGSNPTFHSNHGSNSTTAESLTKPLTTSISSH